MAKNIYLDNDPDTNVTYIEDNLPDFSSIFIPGKGLKVQKGFGPYKSFLLGADRANGDSGKFTDFIDAELPSTRYTKPFDRVSRDISPDLRDTVIYSQKYPITRGGFNLIYSNKGPVYFNGKKYKPRAFNRKLGKIYGQYFDNIFEKGQSVEQNNVFEDPDKYRPNSFLEWARNLLNR